MALPAPPRTTSHRRYFAVETGISVVINTVMAGLFTWLLSDFAQLGTGALGPVARDMLNATIGPVIAFVPPLTLVTRSRTAAGVVAPLPARAFPRLPRPLLARIPMIAAAALVLLCLPGIALFLTYLHDAPRGVAEIMAFKTAYGAAIGLILAPLVLAAALRDAPRRKDR